MSFLRNPVAGDPGMRANIRLGLQILPELDFILLKIQEAIFFMWEAFLVLMLAWTCKSAEFEDVNQRIRMTKKWQSECREVGLLSLLSV